MAGWWDTFRGGKNKRQKPPQKDPHTRSGFRAPSLEQICSIDREKRRQQYEAQKQQAMPIHHDDPYANLYSQMSAGMTLNDMKRLAAQMQNQNQIYFPHPASVSVGKPFGLPNQPVTNKMNWKDRTDDMPNWVDAYLNVPFACNDGNKALFNDGSWYAVLRKSDPGKRCVVGVYIGHESDDDDRLTLETLFDENREPILDSQGSYGNDSIFSIGGWNTHPRGPDTADYLFLATACENAGVENTKYWCRLNSWEYLSSSIIIARVNPDIFFGKKAHTGVTMDSVILPQEKKDQVMMAISQKENHGLIFDEWGFGEVFEKGTAISMLFYGTPGTGKTLMAQAIADTLGLKLKILQSGQIQSSEPGQAERNLEGFFKEADKGKMLLLFDECDSLIADRNEVGMILAAQINALLTGLENFKGVAIFTTNRLGKLDAAFERRLSAKVEFPFPDKTQRVGIWKRLIPEKAPLHEDVDFEALADMAIAGGNIKNAVLNAARAAAYEKADKITHNHLEIAAKTELESLHAFQEAVRRQPQLPRQTGAAQEMGTDGKLSVSHEEIAESINRELNLGTMATARIDDIGDIGITAAVGLRIPNDLEKFDETHDERMKDFTDNVFEPVIRRSKDVIGRMKKKGGL